MKSPDKGGILHNFILHMCAILGAGGANCDVYPDLSCACVT